MRIKIIQVPYDCGHKNQRQGRGPSHFIQNKIDQILEADGHQVNKTYIEAKSAFTMEVGTAFELNRLLADEVCAALQSGYFPMVLSGNCNSCLGTIAGIGAEKLGVVWFDAHGEFNTPETTPSGFLDGMPIAMATGRCWKTIVKTIPGFAPLQEANVVLVGARDLDIEEQRQLERSEVNLVRTVNINETEIHERIKAALKNFQNRVTSVYLHIDMDAFEVDEGAANHYGATGGLTPDFVARAIALVKKNFTLRGCGIASYDPVCDPKGRFLKAGIHCIRQIASEKE
jgi:arginase